MEKIKDALAKAKLENVNEKTVAKVVEQNPQKSFPNTEIELGEISYLNTPVTKLNLAHLERHRIVSHVKDDINSGVFDSLRTQILQKMEEIGRAHV